MRTAGGGAIAFILIVLSGCLPPQEHDSLRFALASGPVTLDPRFATDATSTRINRLLYQRLVDFDEHYQPRPALADWQMLDATHYRFHLREAATFHDGSDLQADDVKATYEFVLDARNGSPHRAALRNIIRIDTPDARTVDFQLERPDPLFPGYLVIGILPAEAMARQHGFNRRPLGSGPFRFLDWEQEGELRLRRVRDGQVFEFSRVSDPTVRVLKLVRGEIDMLQNDLPPEMLDYLERNAQVHIERARGSNFTYLGFNLRDPVSGDRRVREAIAHAIDRRAIIDYLLGAAARPASALLLPEHWAGNAALGSYAYDPPRARELLREAGYDERHPARIVYKTSSDPFRIRLATVIQRQLAEVGIAVDLRSYDWGTFYGDIRAGQFQMFSLSWVGIKTPDIFRYAFHSAAVPPAGANRGFYADPEVDSLIEAAAAATGQTQQAELYAQIQARLFDSLPYVPLWYEDHVFVARKSIRGYTLGRDGDYDGLIKVTRSAGGDA